jgi:hypothetical protein
MSILHAFGAPLGVRAASHIFNFVECVLDIGLEIVPCLDVLAAERVAGIHGQHGLHLQVFTPFQKLQKAKAI